jgi:hypothetical protein
VDEVGIGGKPVSPRLHLSMHEIVANQLWDDEPPQPRQTARRLLALGYERHDVPHMLGSVVAGEVWARQARGHPFDRARFAEALDALPSSWGGSEPAGHQAVEPPVALSEAERAAMDADKLLERCAEQDEASAAAEMGA